jgi:hypothetical protein
MLSVGLNPNAGIVKAKTAKPLDKPSPIFKGCFWLRQKLDPLVLCTGKKFGRCIDIIPGFKQLVRRLGKARARNTGGVWKGVRPSGSNIADSDYG